VSAILLTIGVQIVRLLLPLRLGRGAWPLTGPHYRIFSVSAILLVPRIEDSQCLPVYWWHALNILSVYHSIGRTHRIFWVPVIVLVARNEYSECLPFYKSYVCKLLYEQPTQPTGLDVSPCVTVAVPKGP
jgi:hypothetical protein